MDNSYYLIAAIIIYSILGIFVIKKFSKQFVQIKDDEGGVVALILFWPLFVCFALYSELKKWIFR